MKSALTDHASQENHMINWAKSTLDGAQPHRLNRDQGNHMYTDKNNYTSSQKMAPQLSHLCDC